MAVNRLPAKENVIEQDGCFAILDRGEHLLVQETLHSQRGNVGKIWRLRLYSLNDARRFVSRLRDTHDDLFHPPAPPAQSVPRVG